MIPQFVRAGKRGGPLRPTGSTAVPTNVRPYRVSSGALRILVRFCDSSSLQFAGFDANSAGKRKD